MTQALPIRADDWIRAIFQSRAAAEGGVVRRKLADIDRIVGRTRFLRELDMRGYRAIINGGQLVSFCNTDPIRRVR